MSALRVCKILTGFLGVFLLTGFQLSAHPANVVRFGNVSFDPGPGLTVVDQGETLLLLPNNPMLKDKCRVNVGPVRTGNAAAVIAQIWASLTAGKQIKGRVTDDNSLLMSGGGRLYRHFARFEDGSGAFIILVEVSGKLTPFVLTGDNQFATEAVWDDLGPILMSLKGEADSGSATTAGSTGSGFSVGTPSGQGADPYDSIHWEGPEELVYGIYDIHAVRPKTELTDAVLLGGSFIDSVKPKEVSFGDAIAHVRLLLDNPKTKAEYEDLKKNANKSDPFMLQGRAFAQIVGGQPWTALLGLFAAYELFPNDPDSLVNLAAMLAHCGMPNESLAVLKEMERRGMKPQPGMVNADALMEYLKGFNQLLIGQTSTGKYHLHQAVNLDPFLKEAALALAVAQKLTGEDEEAEKTYYYGVWRRRPAQYLICGGTGPKQEDYLVRPPITDMLDVSRGTPGVLPQFDHPRNFAQAMGLTDRYGRAQMQTMMEAKDFAVRSSNIGMKISPRRKTPIKVWSGYINDLIDTLDGNEPPVKKLVEAKNKAYEEAVVAAKRIGQSVLKRDVALMASPGDHTAEYQQNANDGIGAFRPYAQAYDQALRRWHRTWYRYATGLTAHLGDRDWHEEEVLKIRSRTDGAWAAALLTPMIGWYLEVGVCPDCLKDSSGAVEQPKHGEIAECPEDMKDREFKFGIKIPLEEGNVELNFRQSCEEKVIEVAVNADLLEGKIFDASLGAFVQVELAKKGDTTIFVGVKGDAGAKTFGGTGRAGVYITSDGSGEIKDAGTRVAVESEAKLGESLTVAGSRTFRDERVNFIPSLPTPTRGPSLRE
jgi:hypothetical protein